MSSRSIAPPARMKDREGNALKKWKPLLTGGSVAALVLLLGLGIRAKLFARSDRVPVYPAQGRAEWNGKPIPNATVFLHPVGVQEPAFPRPRATAREDGTFVLGTYGKEDGAPAGEYKVTIQWFTRRGKKDTGRLPENVLPAKYARAETSDLTVRIQAEKNEIPALRLGRVAKK